MERNRTDGVIRVSEVQMLLIRIMTRCSVLVTVSICTSIFTMITIAMRGFANSFNFGTKMQAMLLAFTIFGYIIDFVINMLCIMLQFDFWGKKRYSFFCGCIDGICLRSFYDRAIVVVEKRRISSVGSTPQQNANPSPIDLQQPIEIHMHMEMTRKGYH